jgi:hypothetical protein
MFSTDAVPVLAIALSLVGLGTALPSTAARSALPIVDLGYELHQAAALNVRACFHILPGNHLS